MRSFRSDLEGRLRAEKERSLTIAFVLDEDALRRLDKITQENNLKPSYTLGCWDGSTFQPSSLDELISFPNTDARRINAVIVETEYEKTPFLRVKLSSDTVYSGGVAYRVNGEDKEVFYLADKIEEWISSVQQGYSSIAYKGTKMDNLASFSPVLGVGLMMPAFFLLSRFNTHPLLISSMFFFGVILLVTPIAFARVRRWAFPVGIFATAGGTRLLKKYRDNQRTASVAAVLSVILAFCVHVVAGFLVDHISR